MLSRGTEVVQLHSLRTSWYRLRMVARTGGYYGTEFLGFWVVTQEDPLSHTIFNVVLDAVVWHRVAVMVERLVRQYGHGWEVKHQSALFYTDDGMVASSDSGWLQGDFRTLIGIFN